MKHRRDRDELMDERYKIAREEGYRERKIPPIWYEELREMIKSQNKTKES